MNSKKKAQIITLIITVLILAAARICIYFFAGNPHTESSATDNLSALAQTVQSVNVTTSAEMPSDQNIPKETATANGTENKEAETVNDNFVYLSGGTFTMGSPDSERQRGADETLHGVTLSPFYIDPYEVTQKDYAAIMGSNPSYFNGENLPVENVTWYEAAEYCNKLSEACGLVPVYTIDGKNVSWDRSANGYRLLTEAEWEYAARAGTDTIFYGKDQITSDDANFEGSYPYLIEENYVHHTDSSVVTSQNRGTTIAVDELTPNAFGLYNMHGNVSEWCFDYYSEYDPEENENPAGAKNGSLRINRGGGYNDFAKQLRSAYRSATTPNTADQNLGFRIARNAESSTENFDTSYSLDIQIPNAPKILVAYFSYSGNTENGAEIIAEYTGGDLFEIEMVNPYNGNIYEVSQKDLNNDIRPALAGKVADMAQYDVIILGYPTWWSTMPMPVFTFLEEYDFSGKTILPFSSNGGTRFGDSISDLSKLVPDSYVGQGFEYTYSGGRSLDENLKAWLAENSVEGK